MPQRVDYVPVVLLALLVNFIWLHETPAQVMPTPAAMAAEVSAGDVITSASVRPSDTPESSATATAAATASTGTIALTSEGVQKILAQAEGSSSRTVSFTGLRTTSDTKRSCRHHIFVVDRNGKVLGQRSMPDAWTGSLDIALGKARTAAFFSSNENALSTRQIGDLARPHGPEGTGPAGPLYGIGHTNQGTGSSVPGVERNALVIFAGGLPLYKNGLLVGGIGVSGDAPDQDEAVAFGGAQGFLPPSHLGTPTPLSPKPVDWFPAR